MFKKALPRALPTAETLLIRTIPRRQQTPAVKLSPLTRATWRPESIRHGSTATIAKKLFKQNPFSVTLASLIILAGVGGFVYAGFVYQNYIIGDFEAYPEDVASSLRKALYYHTIDLQPQNALKYYKQALELSEKIGMDPFSNEILGVKLQVAELMENTNNPLKAIEVLSLIHADCLRWLDKLGDKPGNERKRTNVLEKCVRICVRMGQLYSSDAVGDTKAAEEHLGWAVNVLIRERKRRQMEGVKAGEGPWMDPDEMAMALANLGSHYHGKKQYPLAYILFQEAHNLFPKDPCLFVMIINHMASCLTQMQDPPRIPGSRLEDAAHARYLARRALDVTSKIPPTDRRGECEEAYPMTALAMGDIARVSALTRYYEGWQDRQNGLQGGGQRDEVEQARQQEEEEASRGTVEAEARRQREDDKARRGQVEVERPGPSGLQGGKELWERDWDGDGDGGGYAEARIWFERALKASRAIGFETGVRCAMEMLEAISIPVEQDTSLSIGYEDRESDRNDEG